MIDSTKMAKKIDTEFALGNAALRKGDFAQAIRHYCKVGETAPELAQALETNLLFAKKTYREQRDKNERQKVIVFGWDLAHNAAGRAHTVALIYQEFTDVEIIGTTFPKYGHEIWMPIRESKIKITNINLDDSQSDYKKLFDAVLANPSDIVHLSKPRISNIIIGILYKKIWCARVVTDIDDEELAFVDAKKPLALADYLKKYGTTPPLSDFAGREWTRIAVGVAKCFDGITVANEALQGRYGGVIVRHARAQVVLEQSSQHKLYARAHFGIPQEKKVIIFFGTARPHKGLTEIARAIVKTRRDDLLFLVVGDFPDKSYLTELKEISECSFLFLGVQKIESIPLVMSCADYCILYQNDSSEISVYQTPAKLSDALAQGVPILANRFPAMELLFRAGAAVETQADLAASINQLIEDDDLRENLRSRSAELFNKEFSLKANINNLQEILKVPLSTVLEESLVKILDLFEQVEAPFKLGKCIGEERKIEVQKTDVDIVVPVYNALDDVKLCLASLHEYTDNYTVKIIVVNDGSDENTTQWLRVFCKEKPQFVLIEHDANLGYTRAVNNGLKASTAKYVLTQNSDTIVSSGWLTGLIRCMESDANIGIVGPLSNAASWQNVPNLYDEGAFAVNSLPSHVTLTEMARAVAITSTRSYPRLPFINGFCFMIRRTLIDAIGYMDEENFPIGYGEENDYCIRAADAGFELAIADDVYVFHAKSKSFGHVRRNELSKQGSEKLRSKHTREKFKALLEKVKDTSELDVVRKRIGEVVARSSPRDHSIDFMSMRILFLLPVKGGGGGAHSVVQEVAEMRRLGINAHVGVKQEHLGGFLINYADVPHADTLFAGFDSESLLTLAENYDVVVGTIFNSMVMVKRIVECNRHILPAYYVQDYEPMFFESGTESWKTAMESYSLVPGALLFAKTHWIIREVAQGHKVQVCKVSPSIDHEVYRPRARNMDGRIHVVAMVRPGTPRRGASRTMRVLRALQHIYGEQVAVHIFGCLDGSNEFLTLERDFSFVNHGILKRPEVAALLSGCDIFLDLSDYQAFGRTGLEAMACRCAVVLPAVGGTDEYAIDGENSLVIDTLDEGLCIRRVSSLIDDPVHLQNIKLSALQTASRYSVHMAAISEILHLTTHLSAHRRLFPKLQKKIGAILPYRMADGSPSGMAYERMIIPFTNTEIQNTYRFDIVTKLPQRGEADVVIIQRDLAEYNLVEIKAWHDDWRTPASRLIFDIDYQFAWTNKKVLIEERIKLLALLSDVVTTPNELLVTHFPEISGKVRVVPTVLDAEIWPSVHMAVTEDHPHTSKHPLSIGLFIENGSLDGYQPVMNAIKALKQRYGDTLLFEAVSREKHFELDVCARVGYPKNGGYVKFIHWMKERIHWDICLVPVPTDLSVGGEYLPGFRHLHAMGCIAVASQIAVYGQDVRECKNLVIIDGTELSWFEALSKLIEDRDYRNVLRPRGLKSYSANQNPKILLDVLSYNKSEPVILK